MPKQERGQEGATGMVSRASKGQIRRIRETNSGAFFRLWRKTRNYINQKDGKTLGLLHQGRLHLSESQTNLCATLLY